MGMYPFTLSGELAGPSYKKLIPGLYTRQVINLCRVDRSANMLSWSIQAVASADIETTVWISNFLQMPFRANTEGRNWAVPSPTPIAGGLWVKCESIPDFTISAGENYFQQGDFVDTAQFLMFQFMPSFPVNSKKITDVSGTPVDEVALSFVITFR